MLLNRVEFALMNNCLREAVQRYLEAPRLLRIGGRLEGGCALEIGCGRGVGVAIILDVFGASSVDAFDLDPRMVNLARKRLDRRGHRVRLWVGDAARIRAPDATYDAVFDFGIIHHVPDWRSALREVYRVLKPGGRLYAEEVFGALISHPISRWFFEHPETNRFEFTDFELALRDTGFSIKGSQHWGRICGWFAARRTPEA